MRVKIDKENFEKIKKPKFSKKNFDAISFGNVNNSKFSKKILLLMIVFLVGGFLGSEVNQDIKVNVVDSECPTGYCQSVSVNVVSDLSLIPNPNPLDYGDLEIGEESFKKIELKAGNSDLSISVSTDGDGLLENIKAYRDGDGIYSNYNGDGFDLLAGELITFNTKLIIPVNQSKGAYSGKIRYTVMEKI